MEAAPHQLLNKPRASDRIDNRRPKTSIIVLLASKPRDYVPNSGPPLQRLNLLQPKDTTAYIIERILLPSEVVAEDGKPLPKQMTYIVGWTDLPAARALVPAMQILDYVSPRVLEEWETNLEQQLEDDRARLEEERRTEATTAGPVKRKRGRPAANSQIESATAAELEDHGKTQRLKGGAMAQTTPRKAKPKHFESISDTEGSPSRQLERELWAQTEHPDAVGEVEEMFDYYGDSDELAPAVEGAALALDEPGFSLGRTSYATNPSTLLARPAKAGLDLGRVTSDSEDFSSDVNHASFSRLEQLAASPRPAKRQRTHEDTPDTFVTDSSDTPARPTHRSKQSPNRQKASSNGTQKSSQRKPKSAKPLEKQTPQKPLVEPAETEDIDDGWVVKDIEGDEVYEVEGRGLVRYFKVRWEGDWPEDQNPSWEPEENLPKKMVRNYFKKPKERRVPKVPEIPTKNYKQTQLSWGNTAQYSSVSEAFAGDDSLRDSGSGEPSDRLPEKDGENAEFFVVEEAHTKTKRTAGKMRGNGKGKGIDMGDEVANHSIAKYFGFR